MELEIDKLDKLSDLQIKLDDYVKNAEKESQQDTHIQQIKN